MLKIQNSKTLAGRDETVWLLIFRTCSNTVEASTKKIMLDRKPWGPGLAPQVPKVPKQMTHQHQAGNQLIPHLVIFTAKYDEVRNKLTPTLCSPFVNLCWQEQSHPELILQTWLDLWGGVRDCWWPGLPRDTRIMVRHSLQGFYFSPHIPAQPWDPAQQHHASQQPQVLSKSQWITARLFPKNDCVKNNYYWRIKELI